MLLSILNEQPNTNNFMSRKKKEFSLIILRNFMFMPTLKQTLTANSKLEFLLHYLGISFYIAIASSFSSIRALPFLQSTCKECLMSFSLLSVWFKDSPPYRIVLL